MVEGHLSQFFAEVFGGILNFGWQNLIMIIIGGLLLYLAIAREYEPLLLLPIGFGAILINLPLTGLMDDGGILRTLYDAGIATVLFPCLLFIGIGAMTDFGPLLSNPRILLLGGAGQFGIYLTLLLALLLGFDRLEAVSVGIIGACDGPTAIYVSSQFAPHLMGPISVTAYSYMALVPIIQPPVMRLLTTKKERAIVMPYTNLKPVSKTTKILFPILVTIVTVLIAPLGAPLMGMLMLGNLLRESGVVSRLVKTAENELSSLVTLFLGITIGATMDGQVFLQWETLMIYALGLVAIVGNTAAGIFMAKLMNIFSKNKINPLIGAAGISAFPMAARVVHKVGSEENKQNYLLMHAMGANTGGQIGSVLAASIMLALIQAI